ncbi:hypothetical protein EVA_14783 [gut metagenome]|uniref:Uncharacterized protein n=1 Tax=gut metagenome TaxID=749906 RepID=J9FQA1_9ZZZZ
MVLNILKLIDFPLPKQYVTVWIVCITSAKKHKSLLWVILTIIRKTYPPNVF